MSGSVIVAGARPPIGKLWGGLSGFTAAEVGRTAIAAPRQVRHCRLRG